MRTLCLWDSQYFQSFRNSSLFCTFCCFRNLNSAGYGKHCSNHYFKHCAQCVYEICSVFKVIEIAVCFAHFGIFEIWTALILTMLAMVNVVQFIISNIAHSVYMRFTLFQSFRNCCLFCTFWLIRNFYSGEAHHVNYRKHSLNDHFQHCAHCVYDIYRICKFFEMAVCFAHIGLFEIWTALILTMLAMVNVVQIIISGIAHSVYLRLTVFWNFSKLLFVLHILAYSKFLLRWGASC